MRMRALLNTQRLLATATDTQHNVRIYKNRNSIDNVNKSNSKS